MRVLELFSGTHSVGKVCKDLGYEVVSLDLTNADINIDILKWDYKTAFKPGDFDIIWASPPCHTFSHCRRCWIGRKLKCFGDVIVTAKILDDDMEARGLPIVRRTEEIINYFKPPLWFIENPATGKMKDYLTHLPHYDVDYCMYSDWGYKKKTRFWTNKEGFDAKLCNKQCGNMVGTQHKNKVGRGKESLANVTLKDRYRVPPKLIKQLII